MDDMFINKEGWLESQPSLLIVVNLVVFLYCLS